MTKTKKAPSVETPQVDKFREAARELETDQSEEAFDRALKKIAKTGPSNPEKGQKATAKEKARG